MTENRTVTLEAYDAWLAADTGPAALVLREPLMPVEGHDGVLFPATFAAGDGFPGGYNINEFSDGSNVCLVDTVGSQANRIEPLFTKGEYSKLVPQVVVKAGEKRVNLLNAGHRAADAIVRCSALKQSLQDAFKAALKGDCSPLAKLAPTSLVFGVWDSRDTQAKLPRLIASTIRAYNVRELTRSAQYVPATDYVQEGLLEEPGDLKDAEGRVKAKHPFAQRGFTHVPASGSHGGVIATKGVRRESTLHIAALRLLTAGDDDGATKALQRYILGLALTAFTSPSSTYLRQGCNLVADPAGAREFVEVYGDGRRVDATATHTSAMAYAKLAAEAFGLSPDREVDFDTVAAKEDLVDGAGKKASKSRAKPSK